MIKAQKIEKVAATAKMTQEEAFHWFDDLQPVTPDELIGVWRGAEIETGHPMDGLLGAMGWFGKDIRSRDEVYPLLLTGSGGNTYAGNPGLLPLGAFMSAPRSLVRTLFTVVSPLVHTRKGRARLQVREYRGKRTTVMQYDQKPIYDAFARIGDDAILGVSDIEWMRKVGYFFILTKQI